MQHNTIFKIREVIHQYKDEAEVYLDGVPMITVDSITFVKNDIKIYGIVVFIFIILLLTIFFQRIRWVLLPMLNCFLVGLIMIGFLGYYDWPITIVSSNFISLLLIFTLSFNVHQIVRYNEVLKEYPDYDKYQLVRTSTLDIITPCLFMVVTTIAAFGSLVMGDIAPVTSFGYIMSIGLGFAFLISFTVFPATLLLIKPLKPKKVIDITSKITNSCANLVVNYKKLIVFIFILIIVFCGYGIKFLTVENSFIDYYKDSTEIHKGMKVIDQKLGGTTPLDIIVDAPESFMIEYNKKLKEYKKDKPDDYKPHMINGYWVSDYREEMAAIHEYLENLPEVGKVLSFKTTQSLAESKNSIIGNMIILSFLKDKIPQNAKKLFFDRFISDDGNQLRYNIRIYDSDKSLKRNELLKKIKYDLVHKLGIKEERIHITGMMLLYNNVLQSLYDSQIKTVWTVFITLLIMFTILFRSLFVALVAFIPNITITLIVLGIMGWLRIPLDIMTITIAAICTGSADDNTIHYIHRFKNEWKKTKDYQKTLISSHNSIGKAMYYTSITIMLGFSILAFSNFVPTVYFGLLISFAMFLALAANLIFLPALLMLIKPFRKN